MKLLFIADIHIKLGQKNVPVAWALNRYNMFNAKIAELQKDADLVVLGGDIFDRVPTMDEIEVYYDHISIYTKETLIIPGNHESVKKATTFLSRLKRSSSRINKNVRIIDDFETVHGIDFIPYNKLKEYNPADINFHSKLLVTHVRGEIPPHVKPEVPLELFERWETVLAGDLHAHENSQRNIIYPGSPMSTSFHRNPVKNGVIMFDTDTHTYEWIDLELPQLIRKTIKVGEPMEATEFDHTIYEVEGDMSSLGTVENSELLDKKVSTRTLDVSLILDADMTMAEELQEYLTYILQVDETATEDALQVFRELEVKING